jgi:putative membrane protein
MENIELYEVLKALHIVAVISWLAGLLYLPRIFIYHCQAKHGSELDQTFQIMEQKLLKFIITPAMIAVFILGFSMVYYIGFDFTWLHIKLTLVLFLAAFHGFLAKCRKDFTNGKNKYTQKFYRLINEIPTILMILIVFIVILKPFQ